MSQDAEVRREAKRERARKYQANLTPEQLRKRNEATRRWRNNLSPERRAEELKKARERIAAKRTSDPEKYRQQHRDWVSRNREHNKATNNARRRKLRIEAFDAYGGQICVCC